MSRISHPIAVCTAAASVRVAVAPCYSVLPEVGPSGEHEVQVTPAGQFRARDGRPKNLPYWLIDAGIAADVIARFDENVTPLVVDYEHQTLNAKDNGLPAPAAGRFVRLEWREGKGLFAVLKLTQRARQYVEDEEYQFFSPVFAYDAQTGAVLEILMGALTNDPALDGMAQLQQRAAARYAITPEPKETAMDPILLALLTALGIDPKGIEAAALEQKALAALKALQSHQAPASPAPQLRTVLKLSATATDEDIIAACTAAAAKANVSADKPDPAKFVSVEVVEELRTQIAALSKVNNTREVDELVRPALSDGRLLPAQEAWARELGDSNVASLKAYLEKAQPIAALSGTQTGGRGPAMSAANEHGLTADEMAVCAAMGVAPEVFAKANKP